MMMRHLTSLILLIACATPVTHDLSQSVTGTVTVLKSFDTSTGGQPRSGLSLGPDGRLWGTTWQRGPNGPDAPDGSHCNSTANFDGDIQKRRCPGTVFRVNVDGSGFEVVHAFTQLDSLLRNADGYQPTAAPVDGLDGWMYGTTTKGGSPTVCSTCGGRGVLYRINAFTGEFQTVHSLGSVLPSPKDGANPYGGFTSDGLGHLYTSAKNFGQYPNGSGAILRLDLATQMVSVVHGFGKVTYVRWPDGTCCESQTNSDGGNAYAPPVSVDGQLMAWEPGFGPLGGGTIVRFDPTVAWDVPAPLAAAWMKTEPTINTDNAALASLTVLVDRVVGMRPYQGDNGTGEIFALDRDGLNYRTLFSFPWTAAYPCSGCPHYSNEGGAAPLGTLAEDCDGSLVGTTFYGGPAGTGTIYRIQPDGTSHEMLYTFPAAPTGSTAPRYPSSGLTKIGDSWYGTTQSGGDFGPGTIYRLDVQ